MKAKDFRQGNLIEYDGRIFEIDTISNEFPTLNTTEFGIGVVTWSSVKPIKLDLDFLINNCGFEECFIATPWDTYINCGIILDVIRYNLIRVRGYDSVIYLHQLQNLYYILTGKELEIKI